MYVQPEASATAPPNLNGELNNNYDQLSHALTRAKELQEFSSNAEIKIFLLKGPHYLLLQPSLQFEP